MGLNIQPQYHDAGVLCRWIALDIGEIQVQRNQSTALKPTNLDDAWITGTAKCLLEHGVRFVTGSEKPSRQRRRQILIKLEFQAAVVTTRSRASSAA